MSNALLGNGAGSLSRGPGYIGGVAVGDVVVADFDGDGRQDIAVADASVFSASDGQVALLNGTGSGSFIGARSFVGPSARWGSRPKTSTVTARLTSSCSLPSASSLCRARRRASSAPRSCSLP